MNTYTIYKTKNIYLIFGVAIVLSMAITGIFYVTMMMGILFIYIYKSSGTNDSVDLYFYAKKDILHTLSLVAFISFCFIYYIFEINMKNKSLSLSIDFVSLLIIISAFYGIYKLPKMSPKKLEKDYPNIVQERMYDDILIQLDDAFRYRVVDKKIDMRELDISVVDNERQLKPSIQKEIMDIINKKRVNFYDYKLTKITDVEETLKFLNTPIKDAKEQDKFIRYIFQTCNKKLAPLKEDFDFREALKKYSNIIEYAIIELFLHTRNYKNVPMANMIAYANESAYSKHLYGVLDSHTATSIGRYGIGYYVGYHLFNEYLTFTNLNQQEGK